MLQGAWSGKWGGGGITVMFLEVGNYERIDVWGGIL